MSWLKALFAKFVDPKRIGGWVRAGVSALITIGVVKLSAKIPVVNQIITPGVVDYVAVAAGTAVTGVLSNISKS